MSQALQTFLDKSFIEEKPKDWKKIKPASEKWKEVAKELGDMWMVLAPSTALMESDKYYISGGIIPRLFWEDEYPLSVDTVKSDIDIYCTASSKEELEDMLLPWKSKYKNYECTDSEGNKVASPNALNFQVPSSYYFSEHIPRFQIITHSFGDPKEVTKTFDMAHCQAWNFPGTGEKKIFATRETRLAIENRKIVKQKEDVSKYRFEKWKNRGFNE